MVGRCALRGHSDVLVWGHPSQSAEVRRDVEAHTRTIPARDLSRDFRKLGGRSGHGLVPDNNAARNRFQDEFDNV